MSVQEFERLAFEEIDRHAKAIADLAIRWPGYRKSMALGMLGSAIAVADSFGVDVEGFLADLRKRTVKPDVLVPPKGFPR